MSPRPSPRDERAGDEAAIAALITAAFAGHPHSAGTEASIVDALRRGGALTLSLVAESVDGAIVGQVAFSPVTIDGVARGWHALAPLSVLPGHQRRGIGGGLVLEGLRRLGALGAAGCVLVGEPAYYARFGFRSAGGLTVAEPMQPFLQVLDFGGAAPFGALSFHPAFAG